jgi:hypothetical protein
MLKDPNFAFCIFSGLSTLTAYIVYSTKSSSLKQLQTAEQCPINAPDEAIGKYVFVQGIVSELPGQRLLQPKSSTVKGVLLQVVDEDAQENYFLVFMLSLLRQSQFATFPSGTSSWASGIVDFISAP